VFVETFAQLKTKFPFSAQETKRIRDNNLRFGTAAVVFIRIDTGFEAGLYV
jgi:hypothetical protein